MPQTATPSLGSPTSIHPHGAASLQMGPLPGSVDVGGQGNEINGGGVTYATSSAGSYSAPFFFPFPGVPASAGTLEMMSFKATPLTPSSTGGSWLMMSTMSFVTREAPSPSAPLPVE